MGQAASTQTNPTPAPHGAISFSNDLVKKMTEVVEPEPTIEERVQEFIPDYEWFEKLKAIDDNHSVMYGFTVEAFNNLAEKIEFRLNDVDTKVPYAHDTLVNTIKTSSDFSLYSSQEVQNYIESADIYQKRMLKRRLFEKKLEESLQKKRNRRYIY